MRWGGTALGAAVAVSALAWFVLPDDARVPIHIGPEGVDRWAGRLEAVLAVPLGMVFVLLVGLGVTARSARAGQAAPGTVLILAASLWLLVVLHAGLLMAPLLGDIGTGGMASGPCQGRTVLDRLLCEALRSGHRLLTPSGV